MTGRIVRVLHRITKYASVACLLLWRSPSDLWRSHLHADEKSIYWARIGWSTGMSDLTLGEDIITTLVTQFYVRSV